MHLHLKYKKLFRNFLHLNLVGIFFYAMGRYFIDFPSWLYFLLSLPIGVVFLLFCSAVIYDILRVILSKTPLPDSRRKFFKHTLDASSIVLATSLSAKAIDEARHVELE